MQKNTKKKLFVVAVAVCLIAILSFTTLAWFNDTESVKNQFHVATTDDPSNADDIFSVDLWEPVDVDQDGDLDDDDDGKIDEENKDQDGLVFDNIVPGGVYDKAPTVENTGAYAQWVRMIVTVSDVEAWTNILGEGYDLSKIFVGHDETAWTLSHAPVASGDTLTYVYYFNYVLQPGQTATLFTQVQIPGALTQHDLALLEGGFELDLKVDAVQYDNIPAETAKDAFAYVGWPAGSAYPETNP